MTRRLTNAILLSGACLILSNSAFAQLKDHGELNLFGAESVFSQNRYQIGYPQSLTPIPGSLKFDVRARYGVRFGVYTRGHWGEEFFYSYQPTLMHISQGGATPRSTDLHLKIHNYGINALYYLEETESQTFQPFISVGIGGTYYEIRQDSELFLQDPSRGNLADMNNSNELTLNYGLGFKTRPRGHVGLRMDVRGFLGRAPSFGLVRQSTDPTATVLPANGPLHNGEVSAGVIFYFGKR